MALPSDLGADVEMAVVTPYTGFSLITVQTGNFLFYKFQLVFKIKALSLKINFITYLKYLLLVNVILFL